MVRELWQELWKRPWQRVFIIPLLIINISGSVYGYWWYRAQLMETPWYLWVLVADSPLSTTLFALALAVGLFWKRVGILNAVAAGASFKYGAWAIVVLTHYWLVSGDINIVEIGLWLGHLGMVLQAVIYTKDAGIGTAAVLAGTGWLILNDVVDYVFDLHPYLYLPDQETLAFYAAMALTISAGILLFKRILQK